MNNWKVLEEDFLNIFTSGNLPRITGEGLPGRYLFAQVSGTGWGIPRRKRVLLHFSVQSSIFLH